MKTHNTITPFFYAFILSILLFGCSSSTEDIKNSDDDLKTITTITIIDTDTTKSTSSTSTTKSTVSSCGGNENAQTLVHAGETREYIIYVPTSYTAGTKIPLLFNFHGFGGTASAHMTFTNMQPIAESEGFILVYPQGSCLNGLSSWNAGLDTPQNKSSADDFGFILALIDKLAMEYTIDAERVYACGYSNGGFFSYALACYHSDKIAAIGSVAGTMLNETEMNCNPLHPTAMINIHGTSDGVVPYAGGSPGLASIETVLNYWINFNNASTTAVENSVNDRGTTIEQYMYEGGNSGVSVAHYKVIGGGHIWFDVNYNGSNTGRLIWDFVSKYNTKGLIQ